MDIKKLEKAISLNKKSMELMGEFNKELREHFDTEDIDIFYQMGDGWCFLFDGERNAPLRFVDMPHLLTLTYEEACEYLG